MKLIKNRILILFFLGITCVSCFQNINNVNGSVNYKADSIQKAKALLLDAMKIQKDNGACFLSSHADTLAYIESSKILLKAISLDPKNVNLYENIVKTYFKINYFTQAISMLKKIQLLDSNNIEAISAEGFILERIGEKENANEKYKIALEKYENKANKDYGVLINESLLIMLLNGKDAALKHLQIIKNKYPNENVLLYESNFKKFNRSSFIQDCMK